MAGNEVITLSVSESNYIGLLNIRRNDMSTQNKQINIINKDGTPFDFSDFDVVFECRTPNGKIIRDNSNVSNKLPALGEFHYTFNPMIFTEIGEYSLVYFRFEKWANGLLVDAKSTQNFTFNLIDDAYTGTPNSAYFISEWKVLLEKFRKYSKELEDIAFSDKERILTELNALITKAENNITTNDTEFQSWFTELKNSLGSAPALELQAQMDKLLPVVAIYKKKHDSFTYPKIRQVTYWEYGIGTTNLEDEPIGKFGGTNRTEIPFKVEYLDRNTYQVLVPMEFKLISPIQTILSNKNILLVAGIKSIEIEME
ncbi:BppU family phage baseplate upper protein [Listeria monocytogenes]|nr:BppU family phage baseplate upper protein [Listeria monocytogenes]EJT8451549.1 BppU family phage baseplate upper protein [Listeria monocytogenes]